MHISELFPSKYLTATDLRVQSWDLTIRALQVAEMRDPADPRKSIRKPVLFFKQTGKGLILSRVHAVAIAKICGEETDAWPGKVINLYPSEVNVAGQMKACIRVRPPRTESVTPSEEEVRPYD